MIFGVVIGTYSSIFIAAPVLIYLGLKVGAEAPAGAAAAPAPSGTKEAARATRRAAGTAASGRLPGSLRRSRRPDERRTALRWVRPRAPYHRRLRQWRIPICRHVASRLDPGACPRACGRGPVAGVADLTPEVFAPVLAEARASRCCCRDRSEMVFLPPALLRASRCRHRGGRDADGSRGTDVQHILAENRPVAAALIAVA